MQTYGSKKSLSTFIKSAMVAGVGSSILIPSEVMSAPQGGVISQGNGSISVDNKTTTVQQTSSSMVVDWQSFNVAGDELVKFDQPSAKAAALNRIHDQNPSQILGRVDAQGQVYLINPNGIVFGEHSTINIGSLVATTKHLSDSDFMNGNIVLQQGEGEGSIVNRGTINAATGGAVVLVGDTVVNEGVIQAKKGSVVLASGQSATLDFDGDGLLQFKLSGANEQAKSDQESAVVNEGLISAQEGEVLLTAKAARDVFTNVVNNTGVIEAKGIDMSGGTIRLLGEGGDVRNSGDLLASSDNGTGGKIDLSGDRTAVDSGSLIDASGTKGGGAIRIGGGYQGSDNDLTNSESTLVASSAVLLADATESGDGGQVIVWADDSTNYQGVISAKGTGLSGNGGFAEVSGKEYFEFNGDVDLSAENGVDGTLLLDPKNIKITLNGNAPILNNDSFLENANGTAEIGAADLVALLDTANVTLQATNDIEVLTALNTSGNTGDPATTNDLTLEAQDDILIEGQINFKTGATLTLLAGDNITQSESIMATSLVVNTGNNATLTHASNDFGSVSLSGDSVNVNDVNGVDLGTTNLTGTLTLTADGHITQSGVIEVGGATSITSTAGNISFDNVSNDFSSINTSAADVTLYDASALEITSLNATGSLDLTTGGNLTQAGAIVVDGAAVIAVAGEINLQHALNDFASLDASATTIRVRDVDDLSMAGLSATDLAITAGGILTQTGAFSVANNAQIDASNAALTQNNDFNTLSLNGGSANVNDINSVAFGASDLTGALTVTTAGNISQSGAVEVDGVTNLTATGSDITLGDSDNDFTSLALTAVNATIEDKNALSLSTSALTGDLSVTANGDITQSGVIEVSGATSITATGTDITLDNSSNDFNTLALSANNATIKDANALELAASFLTGSLNITSGGDLTQSAAIGVNGSTVLAVTGDITLDHAANDMATLNAVANNISIRDINNLSVGALNTTNLTVTTGGALTQSGAFVVSNNTAIDAVSATLTQNNDFNTLSLEGGSAQVNDINAVALGTSNLSGALGVTTAGNITQSGALDINGAASFTATGADITLDNTGNDFTSLALNAVNAVVEDSNALELAVSAITNALNITTGGNLTQSGAIDVNGATVLAVTGDITIENAANDLTSLNAAATNISVADSNNLTVAALNTTDLSITTVGALTQTGAFVVSNNTEISASTATLTQNNDFNTLSINGGSANVNDINAIAFGTSDLTGALTVSATGNITQSGAIEVDGVTDLTATGANITLNNAGNDFTSVNAVAANISVQDINDLDIAALNTTNLTVTTGGTLTQSGAFVVSNNAAIDALSATLTQNNDFNTLSLEGGTAQVNDINAVVLGTSNLSGALTVTTAGNVTQSGALDINGAASFTATGADITLDNNGNDFTSLALNAVNAVVEDSDALALGVSAITNGLSITTGGDLTQIGAIDVSGLTTLTVTGDIALDNAANDFTSLNASATNISVADSNDLSIAALSVNDLSITTVGALTQTGAFVVANNAQIDASNATLTQNNDFNTLSLNGGSANVNDINSVEFGASDLTGTLTVIAAGNITQSGTVEVDGVTNLTATGSDITLDNSNNDFTSLALTAVNATIENKNALSLSTSALTGDLSVTVNGNITQSGSADVDGTTNLTSLVGNITLDNGSNDFNALALSANNATIRDVNALELAASSLTGSLNITSGGDLTQSAAIDVNGSTVLAVTGDITLDYVANDMATLNASATNINVRDINNLSVGALNTTNLTITTGGALTQSGAFVVSNNAAIDAFSATLTQNNDFNTLSLEGGAAQVNDINAVVLGTSNLSGALSVTTAGNITQSGALDINGAASFTATGADITLDNTGNDFTSLALNAVNAVVEDSNALELAVSAITNALNITTGGNLTQSGAIDVNGATVLAVTGDITIENAANDLTSLNAAATNISVADSNNLTVAALNTTDLSITTVGALTQTGAFVVSNNTEISASTATLTENNDFNTLSINGGSANVNDINAIALGASDLTGTLTVMAAGNITQSGAVEVDGVTDLNATGANITLNNAGNDFTSVNAVAANISVRDTNDLSIAGLNTTDLTIMAGGTLAQSGAFIVANNASIDAVSAVLTQSNDFNTLLLNGGDATVNDVNSLNLGLSNLSGDLTLATTGAISQNAALSVAGHTDVIAGTEVDLQNSSNDFNTLALTANTISVRDSNNLSIAGLTVNDLSLRTGGTLTQTGVFVVANHADIHAANATLNQANNFNTLSLNGGSIEVTDINDVSLSMSLLTGTSVLNLGGGLTQTGSISAAHLDVSAAGHNVVLDNAGNSLGSLSLIAEQATVVDSDGLILAQNTIGQSLDLTAGGAITQTHALAVTDLTLNAVGQTITLDNSNNDFDNLSVTAGNVSITDKDAITLAGANVTNTYTLSASGTVNQSAALTVADFDLDATGQTIQLDNVGNDFSSLKVKAADAIVAEQTGMSLRDSTLLNSLTLNGGGDITQNGILIVPNLFINAVSNNVVLENAANQVDRVTATVSNMTLRDQADLELSDIQSAQFTAIAEDSITQQAGTTLNVTDTLALTANSINLTENNQINSVSLLGGGTASVMNAASLELQGINLTTLTLNVTGDINNSSASNIAVTGDFTAVNSGDVTLGKVVGDSVNFGSVSLNSAAVSLDEDSHILLKNTQVSSLTLNSLGDITDDGDLSVIGTLTADAVGDIALGTIGTSEDTRFGAISLKGANIRIVEEDSMMINRAEGDVVELISETGGIKTNGTKIIAGSILTLDAGPGQDIGDPGNLVDFTLDVTGALTLDARNAYLTQSAADFSKQVALFSSNALIRSEANLAALTRSEIQFLSYLLGVDEALFNEFVTIFDVQDEGMLLPEDQREEELSWLSDDGRFLVSVSKDERFKHYYDLWKTYGEVFSYVSMNNSSVASGWM